MTAFDSYERRIWAGRAAAYERSFAKLCAYPVPEVLDVAGVREGTRILDVGCGSGTVSAAAHARGAKVTAVDAEQSMVDLTGRNVPGVDVRQAVLPELPFDDGAFDVVVANFVINHVGDPAETLTEMRRLLRPGGRIAVTIWPHPPTPLHRLWGLVVEAAGAERPADIPRLEAANEFPRTMQGLSTVLTDAKFAEVSCRTLAWDHHADPEEWWSGPASGVATIGQLITAQTPEMIAQLKHHYDRLSAEYLTDDGMLALPTSALLATAEVE